MSGSKAGVGFKCLDDLAIGDTGTSANQAGA